MGSAIRRTFTLLAIVLVFGESYQREIEDVNLQGLTGSNDAELVRQSNDFAIHLYKQVSAETRDGNVVISPLSISACLSLAAMGAGGLTAEEMFGGLRYGKADQKQRVADWYGRLMRQLASDSSIAVANTLYVKEGYTVKRSFNDVATSSFQSEVHELNFAQNQAAAKTINDWVERKTNNKIKNLIAPDMLDDFTRMVLVNAVHFKGSWTYKFNETNTRPMPFWLSETKSNDVPMMYTKGGHSYRNMVEKGFSALALSYSGSDTSMLVLLPNERNGLAALEETLPSLNLVELLDQLGKGDVEVYLPKFKIEFSLELKDVLTTLGMGRMFSNAAEFPDLLESNEPVKISKAVHKAFIEVNEEGTKAAAATAFSVKFRVAKAPPVYKFKADHPFIYALLSQERGVYFIGKVINPA
ncbi:antichymotrypsin-2-like isoform X1 [Anopheles aquasalis]|uniref:antichymotrypsin-2-like isoform X1 n=1 Tax=Anopheles aquasalis TaxID=42839 RepID=UPI00215A5A74|nr:antichymotrypsin-2-like isoform X1 [Anopheles aquasalis]